MKDPIIDIDTFGYQLWAAWENREGIQLIEREDAYMDWGSAMQYFDTYDDWPDYVKSAVKGVRGKVLDIGCGAGRHALHFQKRGHEVTAIDISDSILSLAEERGVKNTVRYSIEDADKLNDKFDTLFLGGNGLGLLQSPQKAGNILKKLAEVTTEDAIVIGENQDPSTDNKKHKAYHEWNAKRSRPIGQVTMRVRQWNYASPWFDFWFFSQEELQTILQNSPWKIREIYDSSDKSYVAVLVKRT